MSTDSPPGTPAEGSSPWARPAADDEPGPANPNVHRYMPQPPAAQPPAFRVPGAQPPADVVESGPPTRPRTLTWLALGGGGAVLVSLVVVAVLAMNGAFSAVTRSRSGPFAGGAPGPAKPPLVAACPAPTGDPDVGEPEPAPPGPRLADPDAGISYARLGAPWRPWDIGVWSQGTLGVEFRTGFYIVTETYDRGSYLASVLSGKVVATVGDSLTLNLQCAGRQVAEDVRNSYYPRPNRKSVIKDERTSLGGRPAWVSVFHLEFQEEGLTARGETAAVVLVDVGRPTAAVLYLSIPDTHSQLRPEIDTLIASVRPV